MPTPLGIPPNKTFEGDLNIIYSLLVRGENFAFSRFSDGEIYMLQNKEIIILATMTKVGDDIAHFPYPEDDFKHFDPQKHAFYRNKLEEAIKFKADNYYKGLSCRCCVGEKHFKWQFTILDNNESNLTWANLLINYNYLTFLDKFLPIFTKKTIVIVINRNADIDNWHLPFKPKRSFHIGPYCMDRDYGLIEEIKTYIKNNNIVNHVFLIAASSLSNMIIHQCYEKYPNNTYIDIGSSFNPFIPGIKSRRSYMDQLNTKTKSGQPCIW